MPKRMTIDKIKEGIYLFVISSETKTENSSNWTSINWFLCSWLIIGWKTIDLPGEIPKALVLNSVESSGFNNGISTKIDWSSISKLSFIPGVIDKDLIVKVDGF